MAIVKHCELWKFIIHLSIDGNSNLMSMKHTGMLADHVDVYYYTPEYFQQEGQYYNQVLETTAREKLQSEHRVKDYLLILQEYTTQLWTMLESGGLPLGRKLMHFVVTPWPDADSLYPFGGIDFAMTSEGLNTCEENSSSNTECIELSKEMLGFGIGGGEGYYDMKLKGAVGGWAWMGILLLWSFWRQFMIMKRFKKKKHWQKERL
eukprot:15364599-Ditylum_brightwellii.AAC.6